MAKKKNTVSTISIERVELKKLKDRANDADMNAKEYLQAVIDFAVENDFVPPEPE